MHILCLGLSRSWIQCVVRWGFHSPICVEMVCSVLSELCAGRETAYIQRNARQKYHSLIKKYNLFSYVAIRNHSRNCSITKMRCRMDIRHPLLHTALYLQHLAKSLAHGSACHTEIETGRLGVLDRGVFCSIKGVFFALFGPFWVQFEPVLNPGPKLMVS